MENNNLKEIFAGNIHRLRKQKKMTQNELAKTLNVGVSTISDWEKAKKYPRAGVIEKISSFFDIPKSRLFEEATDRSYLGFSKVAMIPIVSNISYENGILAYEKVQKYEATPLSWVQEGEYFYLRIKDDSMVNARIKDGDLILIRTQEDVEEGEIAAVLMDGNIVLKRIFKNSGILMLHSENMNYKPIYSKDNKNIVKILGKLKKIIIDI